MLLRSKLLLRGKLQLLSRSKLLLRDELLLLLRRLELESSLLELLGLESSLLELLLLLRGELLLLLRSELLLLLRRLEVGRQRVNLDILVFLLLLKISPCSLSTSHRLVNFYKDERRKGKHTVQCFLYCQTHL